MGDLGLIPDLRRSLGEGKGYPLQYSGLENSTDCIVRGVTKNRKRLSNFPFTSLHRCRTMDTEGPNVKLLMDFLLHKGSAPHTSTVLKSSLSIFCPYFDLLEKAMATHSSILTWRIPWPEETGGLQSMGLQRVGRD